MEHVTQKQRDEVIAHFKYEGILIDERPYGSGHINDTFLLTLRLRRWASLKVILQRMNKEVFSNPVELMENIMGVTSYLRSGSLKMAATRRERPSMSFLRWMISLITWIPMATIGVLTSLLRMPPVMTRWRIRSISIRVPLHLAISRDCWQTIPPIRFMRRS